MIIHRAKVNLNSEDGMILKGQVVPEHHPRLQEGIARGWIEQSKTHDPESDNPPVTGELVTAPAKDPGPVETVTQETKAKDGKYNADTLIEELPFIGKGVTNTHLKKAGLIWLGDIIGWDIPMLNDIKMIGEAKAKKLLETYREHCT